MPASQATRDYWAEVKAEAARSGRTLDQVRTDPDFKQGYFNLKAFRAGQFRLKQYAESHRAGRGGRGHAAVYTRRLYETAARRVAARTGRRVKDVKSDPVFRARWGSLRDMWRREAKGQALDKRAGGFYARLLQELGIRPVNAPYAVGETP